MVDAIPMVDPIHMVDSIPMVDPIHMVDSIPMVDPIPIHGETQPHKCHPYCALNHCL